MKYNELFDKYSKILDTFVDKYKDCKIIENHKELDNKLRNLLFVSDSTSHFNFDNIEELNKLPDRINKDLSKRKRATYITQVSPRFNSVELHTRSLDSDWRKHMDSSFSNNRKRILSYMISKERNIEYISIECAVMKLYKEGVITLDDVVKTSKNC